MQPRPQGSSYRRLTSCFSTAALLLLGLVWLHVDPKPDPVARPATAAAARPVGLVSLAAPPLEEALQTPRRPPLSHASGAPRLGGGGGGGGRSGSRPNPPPAGSCQPLGPSLVRAAAGSNELGLLIVTFVNSAQGDFALNWLAHVSAAGLRASALIGATDGPAAQLLAGAGASCFPLESSIGAEEAKWGSPGFVQMGRTKASLARGLLELNASFLFADVDVVLLRDPLPYLKLQLHAGAELLFHTDGFGPSAHALSHPDSLELPKHGWGPELNTGLFLMRPSALPLAQAWCAALRSDAAFANWKNDQQSLNELVRRGATLPPSSPYNSSSQAQLISVYGGSLVRVRIRVRVRVRP